MTVLQPAPRTTPLAAPTTVLLGSAAARSCPVKTHRTFDPTTPQPEATAEETTGALPGLVVRSQQVRVQLVEALVAAAPGKVADLRLLADDPLASTAACVQAMGAGAAVIVGGTLPVDPRGHRVGRPDVLLRGADSTTGRPTYHPVVVKGHKVVLVARRKAGPAPVGPADLDPDPESAAGEPSEALEPCPLPPAPVLSRTGLTAPGPDARQPWPGVGYRLSSREGDLLQLAHYRRMLEAAGFAAADTAAAVLGTDSLPGSGPLLVWVDLSLPLVRTASRHDERGWRLRSVLDRYDHQQALRLAVAEVARRRTGGPDDPAPLVEPVVQDECARCVWWEQCRAVLADDDVSLRIDKGALDVGEVLALRRLGLGTVRALADADLKALLPRYLPLVAHRGGADERLRVAARRARMLRDDVAFDRETTGPIVVPGAEVEVDLDVESSADGRVYLWGFLVHDRRRSGPPRYVHVDRFDDLDDRDEVVLAAAAFAWLREQVAGAASLRVYHYSAYEPTVVRALAERSGDATLAWAAEHVETSYVDLYDVVKQHFFGVNGLGLKPIAQHAGFRWRDEDPGGLNSQRWFADAVHHPDPRVREQARIRVLEYNEDDVAATHALRAWLRSR